MNRSKNTAFVRDKTYELRKSAAGMPISRLHLAVVHLDDTVTSSQLLNWLVLYSDILRDVSVDVVVDQ